MTIIINYWAILASMVSSVLIGFVWYGPLFGKKWMALSGIVMPDKKPALSEMLKPIVISLVGAFFMALTLAHSIAFSNAFLGTDGVMAAMQAAFWNWLGFMVPVSLSMVAWEEKPWTLFLIHAGYWLALVGAMATILTVWA